MKLLIGVALVLSLIVLANAADFTVPSFNDFYPKIPSVRYLITVQNLVQGQQCSITPALKVKNGAQALTFDPPNALTFSESITEIGLQIRADTTDAAVITWTSSNQGGGSCNAPGDIPLSIIPIPIKISALKPDPLFVNVQSAPIFIWTDFYPNTSFAITPPVVSTGLTFSPSQINFGPTVRSGTFFITGTQNNTGQVVSFTFTNSDYAPIPSLNVAVVRRNLNLVGLPAQIYPRVDYNLWLTTDISPGSALREVLVTPSSAGLIFDSAGSAAISIKGSATAAQFKVRSNYVSTPSNRAIHFAVNGNEGSSYNPLGDQSIEVIPRIFTVSNTPSEIYLGDVITLSISTHPTPPTSVSLSLVGAGLSLNGKSDAVVTLTPTVTSATVNITSASLVLPFNDVDTIIRFNLFGTDSDVYSQPGDISLTIKKRSFTFSSIPSSIDVSAASAPIYVTIPVADASGLTLTPKTTAGTVTFTPATLNFDTGVTQSFTITNSDASSFTVTFEVGGTNAFYYVPPASAAVSTNKRTFDFSNVPSDLTIKSTSSAVLVSVSRPPFAKVTLTPSAPGLSFSPASLTFLSTDTNAQSFTITSTTSSPLVTTVEFAVSDADADLYAIPAGFPVSVGKSVITVGSIGNLVIGQWSNPISVTLKDQPASTLTITPSALGLTFSPTSVSVAAGQLSTAFRVLGASARTSTVTFGISSTAFADPPATQSVSVILRTVTPGTVNGNLIPGLSSNALTVNLDVAPDADLSVTPTGQGLTFKPASISIPAGGRAATFTVSYAPTFTGTWSGTTTTSTISYVLGGTDAPKYNVLGTAIATISQRTFSFTAFSTLYAGVLSDPITVTIANPTAGLTLTPVSDALTFTPSTITFAAGAVSATFQVSSNFVGTVSYTFAISGTDAAFFSDPGVRTIAVSKRRFIFQNSANPFVLADGTYQYQVNVASPQFAVSVNGPLTNAVTLTPSSSSVTFSPATLTFAANQETQFFSFTPTVVGPVTVTWAVAGADAQYYTVPAVDQTVRITNQFTFGAIPVIPVGTQSSAITVSAADATLAPVTLYPTSDSSVVFSPRFVTLTPTSKSATFQITGTSANYYPYSISWLVKSLSDASFYTYSVASTDTSFRTVTISHKSFNLVYPTKLTLDTAVDGSFAVSVAPRNTVTLTPLGNNMKFNPTTFVFTPTTTSVSFKVTALYATTSDTHKTPWHVDYIVGGPDANDYDQPAQTIHWAST